jgi:hypothetical protein
LRLCRFRAAQLKKISQHLAAPHRQPYATALSATGQKEIIMEEQAKELLEIEHQLLNLKRRQEALRADLVVRMALEGKNKFIIAGSGTVAIVAESHRTYLNQKAAINILEENDLPVPISSSTVRSHIMCKLNV